MFATLRRGQRRIVALLAPIDRHALELVQRSLSGPLDRTAVVSSHLGRGGVVWFGVASLIGGGRRPLGRLEGTAISTLAIGSAFAGSIALGRTLGRPRPCERGIRSLVPCPEGGSFPSDQAAAAFAAAEILGYLQPPARAWIVAGAAIVAISRVTAGVHYPSDVVAGGLIGAAIGRAATALVEHRASLAQSKDDSR
jgi:undecaprenyl-diphosphatase